jgi:hypothetical protein
MKSGGGKGAVGAVGDVLELGAGRADVALRMKSHAASSMLRSAFSRPRGGVALAQAHQRAVSDCLIQQLD